MAIRVEKIGTMEYLRADGIGAPHAFTTRLGGVSAGALESLNLGAHRGDDPANVAENFRILGKHLGFAPENLVLTHQIHTDSIRVVTQWDHRGFDHGAYPCCDGLITNTPGTALAVFTADCTPILLWDSETGAVGAVHAGWRGTAADIAGKAVRKMVAEFGCDIQKIHAAIGPNIGPCCFQTDGEVPQALMDAFGEAAKAHIREKDGKFYPDLKQINALALKNAGVTKIDISADCTMCQPHRFWSHRVHGPQRGAQGAIILCREVHR